MRWTDYIHSDEKILGGKPVFKGTRLSVELIFGAIGRWLDIRTNL
ncbi:MAG: DUF433 domain-containing protein [Saprospiraceae bacterium]|nr:DUF433 domain-containing protein [Saprospiraceae bacterium]